MLPEPFVRGLAVALLSLALLGPAAAAPEEGPHAGVVREGETRVHVFDNHPPEPCPDWFAPVRHTVSLAYAPPTDVLTLDIAGVGAVVGSGGHASLAFEGNPCVRLDLAVTGTGVAALAAYTLAVTTGAAAGA